jgi:hypothetical protein
MQATPVSKQSTRAYRRRELRKEILQLLLHLRKQQKYSNYWLEELKRPLVNRVAKDSQGNEFSCFMYMDEPLELESLELLINDALESGYSKEELMLSYRLTYSDCWEESDGTPDMQEYYLKYKVKCSDMEYLEHLKFLADGVA